MECAIGAIHRRSQNSLRRVCRGVCQGSRGDVVLRCSRVNTAVVNCTPWLTQLHGFLEIGSRGKESPAVCIDQGVRIALALIPAWRIPQILTAAPILVSKLSRWASIICNVLDFIGSDNLELPSVRMSMTSCGNHHLLDFDAQVHGRLCVPMLACTQKHSKRVSFHSSCRVEDIPRNIFLQRSGGIKQYYTCCKTSLYLSKIWQRE